MTAPLHPFFDWRLAGRGLAVLACALVLAPLLLLTTPAAGQTVQANDIQALLERIQKLERALSTLEQQVFSQATQGAAASTAAAATGQPPPADNAARLIRLQALEAELRATTGMLEELSFEMRQVRARMDKLVADVDFRLRALEGGASSGSAATGDGTAGNQPSTATGSNQPAAGTTVGLLPEGTPEEQYNHARGLLLAQDFAAAEVAMQQFVETHPDHDLAAAAQYWLGETHYVRGDYESAALAFVDGYQAYPSSTKGPAYLLKLGISLARLERQDQACATFDELDSAFSGIASSIRQRMVVERERSACP